MINLYIVVRMNRIKWILNFLPIVLVFLVATYTPEMAGYSQTILGKIVAVSVILLYSSIDTLTGVFVCVLIILYYQTDYVESFVEASTEGMENLVDIEAKAPIKDPGEIKSLVLKQTEFRNTHCENGHLIYKGQPVNQEMVQHIFPQIESKCNICDPNCEFHVNHKIDAEEELKPTSARPP